MEKILQLREALKNIREQKSNDAFVQGKLQECDYILLKACKLLEKDYAKKNGLSEAEVIQEIVAEKMLQDEKIQMFCVLNSIEKSIDFL